MNPVFIGEDENFWGETKAQEGLGFRDFEAFNKALL